jgi:glycosyltransferase involved in cell wall biosynthesis
MDKNIEANISILLPVYNDEKYLSFCLESIKKQTYPYFECLVGFNGTLDRSREIAEEIVGTDGRFIIFDYGNERGKSITLNKLLDEVNTEYISLIDGDDFWDNSKLQKQVELLGKYDVLGTLTHYVNEENSITHYLNLSESSNDIREGIRRGHNQIVNSSCLVRKKDIVECGGWDSNFEGIEDFDLWMKLYRKGKTFHNIQEFLVYHRVHQKSNFNSKSHPYSVTDLLFKNQIL